MSYKIVEQMSLEQENFLPDVFYPDNDGDLIFLPIHQRNTSKTKKKKKKRKEKRKHDTSKSRSVRKTV